MTKEIRRTCYRVSYHMQLIQDN